MDVATSALANQIGIVCWRADTDALGRSTKEIAEVMRLVALLSAKECGRRSRACTHQGLQPVSRELVLIVDDVVMGWACGSLDTSVRLQVKVEVVYCSHTTIHAGSRRRISRLTIGSFVVRRVEASMVAFADDDDGNLGIVAFEGNTLTGLPDLWQLLLQNLMELSYNKSVRLAFVSPQQRMISVDIPSDTPSR